MTPTPTPKPDNLAAILADLATDTSHLIEMDAVLVASERDRPDVVAGYAWLIEATDPERAARLHAIAARFRVLAGAS